MVSSSFWSAFWPNVAATIVGVALGLPIALWLNRLAQGAAERRSKAEAETRLTHGIEALLAALSHNKAKLADLARLIAQSKVPFDAGLDIAAWEAARDEIVPFLKRPDLQRRIAYLFARLGSLARLNTMYLDLAVGLASAIGGVEATRDTLRTYVETLTKELMTEIDSISAELSKLVGDANSSA